MRPITKEVVLEKVLTGKTLRQMARERGCSHQLIHQMTKGYTSKRSMAVTIVRDYLGKRSPLDETQKTEVLNWLTENILELSDARYGEFLDRRAEKARTVQETKENMTMIYDYLSYSRDSYTAPVEDPDVPDCDKEDEDMTTGSISYWCNKG
jgi:proline dehydrogenase